MSRANSRLKRAIVVWLWKLIICFALGTLFLSSAQSADEVALRTLVEKFFAAYQRSDMDGLMRLCNKQSSDLSRIMLTLKHVSLVAKLDLRGLIIRKIAVENGKAVVNLIVDIAILDATTGKPAVGWGKANRTLHCVREDDVWRIFRYVSSESDLAVALASMTKEQRSAVLDAEKELVTSELVQELLARGRDLRDQRRYQVAFDLLNDTLALAAKINDKAAVARILNTIGTIYHRQGNWVDALEYYERSLKIAEEMDDRDVISSTLNNIGIICASQGNYARAGETYERSARIAQELGDKDGMTRTLNNLGNVHRLQGHHIQAMECFNKSLKSAQELGDDSLIVSITINIGNIYYSQANYMEALAFYEQSLKISEGKDDKGAIAATLIGIGNIRYWQNNFSRAMEKYRKSLRLAEEIGDKKMVAHSLNSIATVYQSQSNYDAARKYCLESLKLRLEMGDKAGAAGTLTSLGNIYNAERNYSEAAACLLKGLQLREEIGDADGAALIFNNIGNLYSSQHSYNEALEAYGKSLKISGENGNKYAVAATLTNMGIVHYSKGNYASALEVLSQAVSISEQGTSLDSFWETHATAGKAYIALKRADLARQALERAIASVEGLRSQITGSEHDVERFFEDKIEPYHQMIGLLLSQEDYYQAFAYAERAKARSLLDTLQTGRIDITKAMTTDEQAREQEVRIKMNSVNADLRREKARDKPDETRLRQMYPELEKARFDYETFNLNLYAAHPELKIHRGQMQPVSLNQCGELITDRRSALLEYVVTEDKTYLFVLTGQKQMEGNSRSLSTSPTLNVYTLNIKQKDLAHRVETFRKLVASTDIRIRKPACELFDLLLKPAAGLLQGKTRLIVVPDGPLWDLSFQALQSEHGRYLIEDYSLAYAPSLTALGEMSKRRSRSLHKRSAQELFAMGNPTLGKTTISTAKTIFMDERLDQLPDAEKQVEALKRLYGTTHSKTYIGADASEERFKAEAPGYRILHLATHGILNDRNPMYSHLLLSQTERSEKEDGLLEAWELMKLDLKADMAVLSACETARGRTANGEGIIGLSWALFVAGVPTTVVSQWKVESRSTADLMVEFHRQLTKRSSLRVTKADALREAALKLLRTKRHNHPFYWGGFIVVGDGF